MTAYAADAARRAERYAATCVEAFADLLSEDVPPGDILEEYGATILLRRRDSHERAVGIGADVEGALTALPALYCSSLLFGPVRVLVRAPGLRRYDLSDTVMQWLRPQVPR